MPIALIIIGVVIAVAAWRNTYDQLANLVVADFTGQGNFLVWIGAIIGIGLIGYIPKMQGVSRAFLALVLIAIFLSNKGVFANFQAALSGASKQQTAATPQPQFKEALPIKVTGGASGGGGLLGSITGAANSITGAASAASSLGNFLGAVI